MLDGIDLRVPKGSVFALLGSNGAGKTTAIRILSTLIPFDEGRVTIGDYDLARQPKQIRNLISLTGQYAAVDGLLTGEENMHMMGGLSHIDPKTVRQRTTELLEQLDLTDAAHQRVKKYSGGIRRKLDLALSLLAQPPLLEHPVGIAGWLLSLG